MLQRQVQEAKMAIDRFHFGILQICLCESVRLKAKYLNIQYLVSQWKTALINQPPL